MDMDFSQLQTQIEQALDSTLRMDFSREWQESTFNTLPSAITENPVFIRNLIEPNRHLIDLGGKRWRPLFLILCYHMAKNNKEFAARALDEKTAFALTQLVEFVHTASLIHDDIEDSADLRRGEMAAHLKYGLDTALNSASWLYFAAPACLDTLDLTESQRLTFYRLYATELRRLHLGQAMDIYWHRNKAIFPTMAEYRSMVKCKTGTLASLSAQVGLIAGGADLKTAEKLGQTAAEIGVGFQIIDDVINLTKGNPGKKRGDDIVEGKKSLPVLIHVQENPADKEKLGTLMEQAGKEGIDSAAVEECIAILNKSGCIEQAAAQGKELITQSCQAFEENPAIKKLFTSMVPKEFL